MLGGVDGFDEDERQCEGDERAVVLCRFLASECDAFEALELADGLLDAGAAPIDRFGKESWFDLCRRFQRDDGTDTAGPRRGAIGKAVIALVADSGARRDVGSEIKQNGK